MPSLTDWDHVPRMIVKIILGMGPANGRQYYKVNSLVGWVHTQNELYDFINK